MDMVTWPDNVCTLSATCIHGLFTPDDMEFLLSYIPDGSFTPTFGNNHGSKRITPQFMRELYGDRQRDYYFHIPIASERFRELMVVLRLSTPYPLRRGQGCLHCHDYWREPMRKPLFDSLLGEKS